MKKDELGEEANLYFDNYAVIQYAVIELRPQAEGQVAKKLQAVSEAIRECIEKEGFKTHEDDGCLTAYTADEWRNHATADVGVFLRLRTDFKNTSVPSKLGVTAHLHDQARGAIKKAKGDGVAWLSELSEAHGKQTYEQLYRDVDWYDEFETFDEMSKQLAEELIALLKGLRDLIVDKAIIP